MNNQTLFLKIQGRTTLGSFAPLGQHCLPKPARIMIADAIIMFGLLTALISTFSPNLATSRVAATAISLLGLTSFALELFANYQKPFALDRLLLSGSMCFYYYLPIAFFAAANLKSQNFYYLPFELGIPANRITAGLFYATLFHAIALCTYNIATAWLRAPLRVAARFDINSNTTVDIGLFLSVALAWSVYIYMYDGDLTTMLQDLARMRAERIGPAYSAGIMRHLFTVGVFGGSAALLRAVTNHPGQKLLRIVTVVAMTFLVFTAQGSRFMLGFLAIPTLYYFTTNTNPTSWRKKRNTIALLIASVAILTTTQFVIRSYGLASQRFSIQDLLKFLPVAGLSEDQFTPLCQSIDFIDRRGHLYFQEPLLFFPIHFIPRDLWPNKPLPQAQQDFDFAVTNTDKFNVTPSVVGQYYQNLGTPGVIWGGVVFGFILLILKQLRHAVHSPSNQTLYVTLVGVTCAFYFFSFRYFHPLYFQYVVFSYIQYRLLTTARTPGRSFTPGQNTALK